jgi:hypothetical protein
MKTITVKDIERQIGIMEDSIAQMESQLSKVMTPSIRYELIQTIEELKDSITHLADDLETIMIWDKQSIFDR